MTRRTTLAATACALTLASVGALQLTASAEPSGKPGLNAQHYELGLFGDVPYGDTGRAQFPALVDSINSHKLAFTIFDGDTKNGAEPCYADPHTTTYTATPEKAVATADHPDVYKLALQRFAQLQDPVVYTPGDNEWTDCHKAAEGGGTYNKTTHQIDYVLDGSGNPVDYAKGNPVANLDLVRSTFFAHPGQTLGGQQKRVLTQGQLFDPAHPSDAKYVENVMWEESKVMFVTINLPGGSNNDSDVWYGAPTESAAQTQERTERTGADLRWLDAAFAQAKADGMEAVLIGAQADMWDTEKGAAHQAAYEPLVKSVADHTTALGKPVLMINGDSHVYRSDNPLSAADPVNFLHPGYDVANFHRIVVHGSTFPMEWLRLTIDPRATAQAVTATTSGPFSWERMIQG